MNVIALMALVCSLTQSSENLINEEYVESDVTDWYIVEQCEVIRDNCDSIEDMLNYPTDVEKALKQIIIASHKLEAHAATLQEPRS